MDKNTNLSELSDSILSSVKKLIGVNDEDTSFDLDIIFNINAAASTLYQLGVLKKPFTVSSKKDTYDDLLPGVSEDVINQVKMYFVYKTRLGFDSASLTGTMTQTIKEMISEAEWRLRASFNPDDAFES